MKEHENNMEAIDKLFRQSLEDYCPAPPPDVETALMQKFTLKPSAWNRLINYLNLNTFLISAAIVTIATTVYFLTRNNDPVQPELKPGKTTEISLTDKNDPSTPKIKSTEPEQKTENPGALNDAITRKSQRSKPIADNVENTAANTNIIIQPTTTKSLVDKYPKFPDQEPKENPVTVKASEIVVNSALTENPENSSDSADKLSSAVTVISREPEYSGSSSANQDSNIGSSTTIHHDDSVKQAFIPDAGHDQSPGISSNGTSGKIQKPKGNHTPVIGYNISLLPTFGGIFQKSRDVNIFYGGQINAGLIYKPIKLGLETGLGFEKYTDRGGYEFTYQKTDTLGMIYDTTWILLDSTWYPDVTTSFVTQDRQFTDVKLTRLSYSYFTIPVYLTKQIYENKLFRFGIKSGINVIFLSSKSEPVPSSNLALGTLTSQENISYTRNNLVWQLVISPQILFHLNRNLSFQIEPTYRRFLNELYIGNYKPAGTPNPFSVNAGLRFEL